MYLPHARKRISLFLSRNQAVDLEVCFLLRKILQRTLEMLSSWKIILSQNVETNDGQFYTALLPHSFLDHLNIIVTWV